MTAPERWRPVGFPVRAGIDCIPQPWARARINRTGRHYTPKPVEIQQEQWKDAWGYNVNFGDAPLIVMSFRAMFPRPASHLLRHGDLSAVGRRRSVPKGDIDNLLKLVLDALSGIAYDDDRQIVAVRSASKFYGAGPLDTGYAEIILCGAEPAIGAPA